MLEILWDNINLYLFLKNLKEIDVKIFKKIIDRLIIEKIESNIDELSYNEIADLYFFISECYWYINEYTKQVLIFEKAIINCYVRHWWRKDYYITFIVELLELFIENNFINVD